MTDKRLFTLARDFALKAHEGQRYGDSPYSRHLRDTVNVLGRFFNQDEDLFCAAWLHDCIEDTGATEEQIKAAFGPKVADLVVAVTRRRAASGKEPLPDYYARIRAVPGATFLKLADRVANVEACLNDRRIDKLTKYRERHAAFRQALWVEGKDVGLWSHLDAIITRDTPLVAACEIFLCATCGNVAGTLALLPPGVPGGEGQAELRLTDFLGTAGFPLKEDEMQPALDALKKRDLWSLRRLRHDAVVFFCPECAKPYCAGHWKMQMVVDEGHYDCTWGYCPSRHRHMVDD